MEFESVNKDVFDILTWGDVLPGDVVINTWTKNLDFVIGKTTYDRRGAFKLLDVAFLGRKEFRYHPATNVWVMKK